MKKEKNSGYPTAEDIFARIGTGKKNAIPRPTNPHVDRRLRSMIEHAQCEGEIIINSADGSGYFHPDFSKPDEVLDYHHYISAKKSRIQALAKTIIAMECAVTRMESNG